MPHWLLLLALVPVLGSCSATNGPVGSWSDYRYDRQLLPHGPWRDYYAGPPRHLEIRPRFRHGRAVGTARYYNPMGTLERREKYCHRPAGLMHITHYYPNGRLWRSGAARVVKEPDGLHFYWFGEWRVYAPTGQPVQVEYYERGKLVTIKKL